MKCQMCGKTKGKSFFYHKRATCMACVITLAHGDKPDNLMQYLNKTLLRLPFKGARKWQKVLSTGAKDFNNAA